VQAFTFSNFASKIRLQRPHIFAVLKGLQGWRDRVLPVFITFKRIFIGLGELFASEKTPLIIFLCNIFLDIGFSTL
jgi:hypothetical protein